MKTLFASLIAAMMLLSLAACDTGNEPDSSDRNTLVISQDENNNGDNHNNSRSNDHPVAALGRADMESWIAARLSAIGGPSAISLFDGSKFEYTEDGIFFAGDYWDISGVTAAWDDIEASLDSQLSSYGFKKEVTILGTRWYIRAGSEQMGFTVGMDSDGVTIWMTHKTSDYNQSYIDAAIAKMPDIIPGRTALDKMPESFLLSYNDSACESTVVRLNGDWYFKRLYLDSNNWFAEVFLLQEDGTYAQYSNSSVFGDGIWDDDGITTQETLDSRIEEHFDADGQTDRSISTYLQICLEYQEGEDAFDLFEQPSRYFDFSSTLVKTGTATVAGVAGVVCTTDDLFENDEFTYDPQTGILLRLREFDSTGNDKITFEVKEFSKAPASLGDFVQP